MLPLYLAGAAVLGVGAYLFTHKKKIPPSVAQAAIQSSPPAAPAPAARPSPSTVITPDSPEVLAAAAAAANLFEFPDNEGNVFRDTAPNQFPGTGIQAATQFNPSPGSAADFFSAAQQASQAVTQTQNAPEQSALADAAQTASEIISSGTGGLAAPVETAFDLLNQFTNTGDD